MPVGNLDMPWPTSERVSDDKLDIQQGPLILDDREDLSTALASMRMGETLRLGANVWHIRTTILVPAGVRVVGSGRSTVLMGLGVPALELGEGASVSSLTLKSTRLKTDGSEETSLVTGLYAGPGSSLGLNAVLRMNGAGSKAEDLDIERMLDVNGIVMVAQGSVTRCRIAHNGGSPMREVWVDDAVTGCVVQNNDVDTLGWYSYKTGMLHAGLDPSQVVLGSSTTNVGQVEVRP